MFRRALTSILLCLSFVALTVKTQGTDELYINKGTAQNVQVDARNFVNEGLFSISVAEAPWDSQNTINFTNRGTITGSMGFRFETVDSQFPFLRRQASNFVNAANASITAFDGGGILPFANGTFVSSLFEPDVSYLTINSRNVTNRGDLTVGASGLMQLTGRSVDLSGGTMIVENVNSSVSSVFGGVNFFASDTNFFPAAGVYDLAYGIDLNTNMPISGIVRSTNPNSFLTPDFNITNAFSAPPAITFFCPNTSLFLSNTVPVFVRDEFINATNRVVQVVAVSTTDTNIGVFASFYPQVFPSGVPQGGYLSPLVEFRVASTNFRTLDLETNSFYVFDQLGSHTNYALAQNSVDGTFRPAAFITFRSGPGLGELGFPGLPFIKPDIFDDPGYTNRIATNQYAAYALKVESLARRLPDLQDLGVTNLPGRVEVKADDLKLNNTRIRAEGLISLSATNITGGQNTVLDVPRLNVDLSTKSSVLDLKDMTPDSVERFGGYMQIYSGLFTNGYSVITGSGTNAVTNNIEIRFEFLAINADDMHTREPVIAHEVRLKAGAAEPAGLLYEENLIVTNLLQISASDLTFGQDSRLYLSKGIGFSYTNLVGVSAFTNFGQLQINELAELRKDAAQPYDQFVNRGSIYAFATDIQATYFENSGDILSSNNFSFLQTNSVFAVDCFGRPDVFQFSGPTEGLISITADTAKIDAGTFSTGGDIYFSGSVFKLNNHRASAGGKMILDVRDVLTDTGEAADNLWTVNNGFEMSASQPAGDLLGTEIRSVASKLAIVDHRWSAADRGPTVDGFTDNLALGRLVMSGADFSIFQFLPGRENSAIYVDVLQIEGVQASSIREFTNRVQLSMNVYYGNIESTNAVFSAEKLNRILGPDAPYNFIWVPEWAGPNSGVDVPLTENGPVRRFNRALRESPNIDSDGDGLPNLFDPFPFPPEAFGITGITLNPASQAVSFGFTAASAGTYVIEYTTNLVSGSWQPLTQLLQKNPSGGIMSFTDQVRAGDPQRYYRVRKAP